MVLVEVGEGGSGVAYHHDGCVVIWVGMEWVGSVLV